MLIFDWYLLTTALFGTIVLLTLITLKLALKSEFPMTWSKVSRLKSHQASQQSLTPEVKPTIAAERPSKVVLSYLIRNHSIAEPCLGRKSCNKLPVLLSISSISVLCFLNPSLIVNSLIGLPITLFFVIYRVCSQPQVKQQIMDGQIEDLMHVQNQVKEEDQNQSITINKTKVIYIVFGLLASAIALFLCGATFKNYSNLFLVQFLKNTVVSCIADLVAIKTVGFLLLCFPLSFNNRTLNFIQMEQMKQLYLEMVRVQCESGLKNFAAQKLSPRKKQQTSPSKIPKAIPRLSHANSQNQALKNAMDIAKKIKRQKMPQNSDMLRTLSRINDVENSAFSGLHEHGTLHQLIVEPQDEQNVRGRQTPVAALLNDEDQSGTAGMKTRRKDTDLVIVEFKKDEEHQSQTDQDRVDSTIQRRATSFLHSNLDFEDDLNTAYRRDDSSNANSGVNPSYNSGDNKLNIVKILDECVENIQQEQRENQRRRNDNNMTLNLERFDHLHINDGGDQDGYMEQIDGNSPQRRRKMVEGQDSQYKLKKKAKHFNGQAKRRVIRFTSGEPYLQYLPNMLSKDSAIKHKKSQPINTKPDLSTLEEGRKTTAAKKSKTKKQHKYTFGGDENEYPGALEVEDL